MSTLNRGPLGSAFLVGRESVVVPNSSPSSSPGPGPTPAPSGPADLASESSPLARASVVSVELLRALSEVKGQAQFLLYLADQIEDSLHQLGDEPDDCQNSFLCRVLGMYSAQLESKHQGLGDKIAETCQEVYVTVREFDAT